MAAGRVQVENIGLNPSQQFFHPPQGKQNLYPLPGMIRQFIALNRLLGGFQKRGKRDPMGFVSPPCEKLDPAKAVDGIPSGQKTDLRGNLETCPVPVPS